jgi:hypothetical protein
MYNTRVLLLNLVSKFSYPGNHAGNLVLLVVETRRGVRRKFLKVPVFSVLFFLGNLVFPKQYQFLF